MSNYERLALGMILNRMGRMGNNYDHGDCFNYGSVGGCDEDCPVLNDGRCEIYKDIEDYILQTK
jgi:hypothetical protein